MLCNFSRKEFKPTIPARRKKQPANQGKAEPLHTQPPAEKTASFDEKLKQRLSGKPNVPNVKVISFYQFS